MSRKIKTTSNQDGFVSIIVTLIIMIILTLIVIGFAQLARREQRSALDRQLSTQAFYAAESGVNDLVAAFQSSSNSSYFNAHPSNNNCSEPGLTNPPPSGLGLVPTLDAVSNVRYTCLLYDTTPDSIDYTVSTEKVQIIPVNNPDLTKLSFNWKGTDYLTTAGVTNYRTDASSLGPPAKFTPNDIPGKWKSSTGVLRIMIIPRDSTNRSNFIGNTFNGFLYPNATGPSAGGIIGYTSGKGGGSSGVVIAGNCNDGNTPSGCNADITITNADNRSKGYYIVVHSVYTPNKLTIRGYNSAGLTDLLGAQISVDATGQANDVLRRINVRRPISTVNESILPLGFESMESLCKQIILKPGEGTGVSDNPGNCSF